jgi:hypothetical protein
MVENNCPRLNEIFTEEYWVKRESVANKHATRIIPWKEGFLFLLPIGGLVGTPILIGLINTAGKVGHKLGSKLGFKCRTSHEIIFDFPYSEVVFSLVVSLRKLNINILSAEDTEGGAKMLIEMKQDMRAFGGTIAFEITEKDQKRTQIEGTSEVKGQLKDWGKGKRYMNEIFEKMEEYVSEST